MTCGFLIQSLGITHSCLRLFVPWLNIAPLRRGCCETAGATQSFSLAPRPAVLHHPLHHKVCAQVATATFVGAHKAAALLEAAADNVTSGILGICA